MDFLNNYDVKTELGDQKVRKFGRTIMLVEKETKLKRVAKIIEKTKKNISASNQLMAESTFSFNDSSLPSVISKGETDQFVYVILDYKPGITIDKYWTSLRRKERHPFLIQFLEKLAPIFQMLQNQEIVHCDIKPSNILIDKSENGFEVFLIDFGLAYKNDNKAERTTIFPLGYAAPELILNHLGIVNQTTDIFSLGVLIWRLYTGELPMRHANPSIYTNLQLNHPLPSHSAIPKEIFRIILKMTKKHSFKLPPNKMNHSDVELHLTEAQSQRYNQLSAIIEEFKQIKFYLFQMISRR